MRQIIDSHTHFAPASRLFQEWAEKSGVDHSLEGLLREMDENGVSHAIVMGHWDHDEGIRDGPFEVKPNNDLVEAVKKSKGRLRGLLTVNLDGKRPMDLDVIDEHLRDDRFVGVKCFTGYDTYTPDDPRLEPLFKVVEERDAVVVFHTGSPLIDSGELRYAQPLAIDTVAANHPELKLVIAHAGHHWMYDAGRIVGKNPNVWADISAWFVGRDHLPPHIESLKLQFQALVYWATVADHLMYGTDWPLMSMKPYIEFVESCDFLSEDEKQKIFHGNAEKLFWGK